MEDDKRARIGDPKRVERCLGEEKEHKEKAANSRGYWCRLEQVLKRGTGPSKGLLLKKESTGDEQRPCRLWLGDGEGAGRVFRKKEQGSVHPRSSKCPLGV